LEAVFSEREHLEMKMEWRYDLLSIDVLTITPKSLEISKIEHVNKEIYSKK
jgi:hypothetical protein